MNRPSVDQYMAGYEKQMGILSVPEQYTKATKPNKRDKESNIRILEHDI